MKQERNSMDRFYSSEFMCELRGFEQDSKSHWTNLSIRIIRGCVKIRRSTTLLHFMRNKNKWPIHFIVTHDQFL